MNPFLIIGALLLALACLSWGRFLFLSSEVPPIADPNQFSLTITEKDRQTAGPFCNPETCLLATALRSNGHKDAQVGVTWASLADGTVWFISPMGSMMELCATGESPFYGPEVAGKTFTFTRQ